MFITSSLKWYLYHYYHVKNGLDISLLLNLKKCHTDVIRCKIRCRYPYVITSTLLQIRSPTAYITSLRLALVHEIIDRPTYVNITRIINTNSTCFLSLTWHIFTTSPERASIMLMACLPTSITVFTTSGC